MCLTGYTNLAFQLIGIIDTPSNRPISREFIRDLISKGTIFEFLEDEYHFDISLWNETEKRALLKQWREFVDAYIDHKLCVENNGLCLLLAYLLEAIQQQYLFGKSND